MDENKFINGPQLNFQPTLTLYNELLTIKRQKSADHMKLKSHIYLGLTLGVSIIFGYLTLTQIL